MPILQLEHVLPGSERKAFNCQLDYSDAKLFKVRVLEFGQLQTFSEHTYTVQRCFTVTYKEFIKAFYD